MTTRANGKNSDARIAIIGAGAAGLATAYYLKKNGYKNVIVLEKLPRIGGLCRTITQDYKSFDLGANYITPAYRELLAMAREVGAKMYSGHPYTAATVPDSKDQPVIYCSMLDEIRRDPNDPTKKVPLLRYFGKLWKFFRLRRKLSPLIDVPTFAGLVEHDKKVDTDAEKLCVPFETWLERNDLLELRKLFEIPITMEGFGYLRETPAPYVLKFMTLATFLPMILKQIPPLKPFFRWPKRFVHGYERLWQAVAADLNVFVDIDITRIGRAKDPDGCDQLSINFQHPGQVRFDVRHYDTTLHFDYLILACPLDLDALRQVPMYLHRDEKTLFEQVRSFSYCMTTLHVADDLPMPTPVSCVFPFNKKTMGKPWAVVHMYPGESRVVQFYTRVLAEEVGEDDVREKVVNAVVELVYRMGGSIAGWSPPGSAKPEPIDPSAERLQTYDRWAYFQHVTDTDFAAGFYDDLEDLQGQHDTYYVGGPTNFQLIEPILGYAKALVNREFPPVA